MRLVTKYDPLPLSAFQTPEGEWHEEPDWPRQRLIFICKTETCDGFNVEIPIDSAVNVDGVIRSICGHCRNATEAYDPET